VLHGDDLRCGAPAVSPAIKQNLRLPPSAAWQVLSFKIGNARHKDEHAISAKTLQQTSRSSLSVSSSFIYNEYQCTMREF
jgi:hypothetical protein